MNKVVTDIASKVLVTLAAGAGALLAKSATEKGLGSVIKKISENKEAVKETVEAATETATEAAPDVVTAAMDVVQEVAEKAEEVSGA